MPMREPYSLSAAFSHLVLSGDLSSFFQVVGASTDGSMAAALDQFPRCSGALRVQPERRGAGSELA
jgi:hypothetical protein